MSDLKILVVSDSHGNNENIRKAIEIEKPFDILVHCGDIEGSLETVTEGADYEVKAVRGNCDGSDLPIEEEFKAGFFNVWVTHGDRYNAKYDEDLLNIKQAATNKHADIVFFGHSHFAEIVKDTESGITFVNPGSIGNPRSSAEKSTYAVVNVTDDYEIIAQMKELPDA